MSFLALTSFLLLGGSMEAKDHYVNDIEASKILAVSPQTLRNYRHLGKGPACSKRGRMVRYRVKDLLDFMEEGRIDPEARAGQR
jgi:hypothetical protein